MSHVVFQQKIQMVPGKKNFKITGLRIEAAVIVSCYKSTELFLDSTILGKDERFFSNKDMVIWKFRKRFSFVFPDPQRMRYSKPTILEQTIT